MAKPPPLSLVAKAMIYAAPAVEASILAMALSQSIGEGSWSSWSEGGEELYPFEGTHNFGAIHATEGFATTYANGGSLTLAGVGGAAAQSIAYDRGWGMVAFLDHNPAPYITRMAVYPSLVAGAFAFLGLVGRYVNLQAVADVRDYAAQLYVHNYFEGFHPNRTILANRARAYQTSSWSDDDVANIADYAALISGNLAAAQRALSAVSSEPGDPTLATHGPPFAPLGVRLTPSGRVLDHTLTLVAGAPHTLERARQILGDYHPGAGAISIDDALSSPAGDGVWMFPDGVAAPAETTPAPAPPTVTTRQAEEIGVGAIVAGAALGAALLAAGNQAAARMVSDPGGRCARMISRELMIGGTVLVGLIAGGAAAYAAVKPAAAAASTSGIAFTKGHRYEIDFVIPAGTISAGSAPSSGHVQDELELIASGAFHVVGVGVSVPATAAAGSGFTFYVNVDALQAVTVTSADLMLGMPTGTTVTVTDQGATPAAAAAGSSSSSSSSSTTSTTTTSPSAGTPAPPATSAVAKPVAGGWLTLITLGAAAGATSESVNVTGWPGDAIELALPNGATWAASGSTAGFPTSGSQPWQGTYSGPVIVTLAWKLGGLSYTTTLTFTNGRTWGLATSWQEYDTVRISVSLANFQVLQTNFTTNAAEIAALQAAQSALLASGVSPSTITGAQGAYMLLSAKGPLDTPFAIEADSLKVWVVANALGSTGPASVWPLAGGPLPSDWPASDTDGIIRAEFRYTGTGISLTSLAFPLTSWVRLT